MTPEFRRLLRPIAGPRRQGRREWTLGNCPSCDGVGFVVDGACTFCGAAEDEVVFAELDLERKDAA